MQIAGLDSFIREHPLFEGLDEDTLALIAGCARNVHFAAGAYLFREGGPAVEFYLLRAGRVALEIASPGRPTMTILTIGAGEVAGVSWLVPPYRWQHDARAVEEVRATSIGAECLRQKCEADPRLGYALMKRVVPMLLKRLRTSRLQMLDVAGDARPWPATRGTGGVDAYDRRRAAPVLARAVQHAERGRRRRSPD
jgi:CRP/FNR family cyclic AMP-dependent transcriptional regulator